MATWMMHMLIADKLLDDVKTKYQTPTLDYEAFVLGSVGADAGDVTPVKGVWDPPAHITHWTHANAGGDKSNCRYMDFYHAYVKNETDVKKWSFYIGYWIHLYTDVLWHRLVYMPLLQKYCESLEKSKNPEVIQNMRKSSLACELEYLQRGNNFMLWNVMKNMNEFPTPVLPYYHSMSLTNHIHLIQEVYGDDIVASFTPPEHRIFFLEDWIAFADIAVKEIGEFMLNTL